VLRSCFWLVTTGASLVWFSRAYNSVGSLIQCGALLTGGESAKLY
jgi:hypothetical protein